jgi:hypothetical protein
VGGKFGSFAFADGSAGAVGQRQMCQMWAGFKIKSAVAKKELKHEGSDWVSVL